MGVAVTVAVGLSWKGLSAVGRRTGREESGNEGENGGNEGAEE